MVSIRYRFYLHRAYFGYEIISRRSDTAGVRISKRTKRTVKSWQRQEFVAKRQRHEKQNGKFLDPVVCGKGDFGLGFLLRFPDNASSLRVNRQVVNRDTVVWLLVSVNFLFPETKPRR